MALNLYYCFLLFILTYKSGNAVGIAETCITSFQSINDPTPSPTNVYTSVAKLLVNSTALTFYAGVLNFLSLKNAGNIIEAYPNHKIDKSTLTGGILCNNIYDFQKAIILINQNPYGKVGSTIDGKGSPIEVNLIFYKRSYGSFKNSLYQRDGIVTVGAHVSIGNKPNPFFFPMQLILYLFLLIKPGSSVAIFAPLFYSWFDDASPTQVYYACPANYIDYATGRQYNSSTNIQLYPTPLEISFTQFESFKFLLGYHGLLPLQTNVTRQPFGNRPLYKGIGVQQVLIPF